MSKEEQLLISQYTTEFIRKDKMNANYYCNNWNGTNGIYFGVKMPEDFIMDILARINEGRRKCYLKDYRTFRNSVYYHLRNEMLTYFKCTENKKKNALKNENIIPLDGAVLLSYDDNIDYKFEHNGNENIIENIEKEELQRKLLELFDPNIEVEEILVLEGILEGKKRWEIAEDLGITENDVTVIQKRIFRKANKRIVPVIKDELKNVKCN